MAAIASRSRREDARPAGQPVDAVLVEHARSIAVLLMTLPPGARLPPGKQTVDVMPFSRARSGGEMTSSGSTPSPRAGARAGVARRSLALPLVEHVVPGAAEDGHGASPWSRPSSRRCSITSGTPPARKTRTVGWLRGPFGSASTSRGTAGVDSTPVVDGRARADPPRARSPGCG